MKAIIMAGGEGTRLRPITDRRPKPMTEIYSRPVLEYTVRKLVKLGHTELSMTLRYLPDMIKDYFGGGERFGAKIEYLTENEPLGTAGGVRALRSFYGDEPVLIMSGDAVWDLDLNKLIRFHQESGAAATLALYEHNEPTEYGTVVLGEGGRIKGFREKPSWDRVVTDRVNTGIYVLSKEAVDMIPEGKNYDFGKDLFPAILAAGLDMRGLPMDGYWRDIGSPEAYRQCCMDVVSGKLQLEGAEPEERYPGSVTFGAKIGPGARLDKAVVMPGARIGAGAVLKSGTVVGEGAVVGDGAVLAENVRISAETRIKAGEIVTADRGSFIKSVPGFYERGRMRGDYPSDIDAEVCLWIGRALGSMGRTGIGRCGGNAAFACADAVSAGVRESGGAAFITDDPFEASLRRTSERLDFAASVFIRQSGSALELCFFSQSGTPASDRLEREVTAAVSGKRAAGTGGKTGFPALVKGAERQYLSETARPRACDFFELAVSVSGAGAENRALKKALALSGCRVTDRAKGIPDFTASEGGFELSCVDERGRRADSAHLALIAGREADAAEAAAVTALRMRREGKTLAELIDALPEYHREDVRLKTERPRAGLMREISERFLIEAAEESEPGLLLSELGAKLRVIPGRNEGELRITAEAESKSACDEAISALKSKLSL
ncbi:MAG: NTP transferase domain-containing protein [Oscillospiraceae bacterium]|nr:NTP transferase domain-containing protein [Oscillospiraceae bacterium]